MDQKLSENGERAAQRAAEPDEIPPLEQQIEEVQQTVEDLRAQNATLHEQMLQANLYELQQRRENSALRAELQERGDG